MITAERDSNLHTLIADAFSIYGDAIAEATRDGHSLAGTVLLFSGGNDSTTVAHLFRKVADYAGHCNTGIGIEATRQFVRDTCVKWELPLLEKHCAPGVTYRDLVLGDAYGQNGKQTFQGFPEPKHHRIMYNKLKERGLRQIRRDLVKDPRRQRVIFISGIRQAESARRANREPVNRDGSVVFCNPITHWTKLDLNAYRRRFPDIPHNEVADHLHMSGECLCGSFAHLGLLDEIALFYPETASEIRAMEAEAEARGIKRCRWGQGGDRAKGVHCENECNL